MHLVLDLLQGIGLAAAIGVRPFLPVLLAGALAAANVGLDFDGTDFSFLEKWPFLLAVLVVVGGLEYAAQRRGPQQAEPRALVLALGGVALALGALEAAGSLADHGYSIVPGVVLGAAAAALGFLAARSLFNRVRRRLAPEAARAPPLYRAAPPPARPGPSRPLPPPARP